MKIFCNNYDVIYIVEKVLKKCYSMITFSKTMTEIILICTSTRIIIRVISSLIESDLFTPHMECEIHIFQLF